ncbi:MAG: hypothetical protein WEB19_02780 [Acidimicrobiia bacterium]
MDPIISSLSRKQHGLVTRAQLSPPLSRRQVDRLVGCGDLELVRRGVYRVAGAPVTWQQHLLAACLARSGSCASFRAAAALWGLPGFDPEELEITVPGSNRARLEGVIVHESQVWGPDHLAMKAQIPVTSAARTLCDLSALSAVVAPWMIERATDDALRRKIVTLRALTRAAEALEGRGRLRSTVTRAILDDRQPGYHPGDSEPEKRISDLLVRAGLPRPVPQYRIRLGKRTVRADLAYPELMIVMEYDSWEFHSSRTAFDNDAERRNQMRLAGFTVLEFTSKSSDRSIVDTVTAARDRASVTLLPPAVAN